MEENKLPLLKPKTKLRELKAIQKDQESYRKTLERLEDNQNRANNYSDSNDSSDEGGSHDSGESSSYDMPPQQVANKPLVLDREAKKMQ